MNNRDIVMKLVEQLASMVHAVEISSHAGIFGSDVADSALLQMRKAAAELVQATRKGVDLAESIDTLESALRSAQLVYLLSHAELKKYLEVVDELRLQTDKE